MQFVSVDTAGESNNFITIYIISHGYDCTGNKTPPCWQGKIHKLSLGGVTGNGVTPSRTMDALFFNTARRLAHDRVTHHIEKLHEVRNEVLRYAYINEEIEFQQTMQEIQVEKKRALGVYSRALSTSSWITPPSEATYNRHYDFNPKCKNETNQFGVWLADASMEIATQLGFLPGIRDEVISLMPALGLTLTSKTFLFDIVSTIHSMYGSNTYVNVIDMCCRAKTWSKSERSRHWLGAAVKTIGCRLPLMGAMVSQFGSVIGQEAPSPTAAMNAARIRDIVSIDGLPHEVVYWERDGKIKYYTRPGYHSPVVCSSNRCESDRVYDGQYRNGDTITFSNGKAFNIFYILPGPPTWFFCHHANEDGSITTLYLTPRMDQRDGWHITARLPMKKISAHDHMVSEYLDVASTHGHRSKTRRAHKSREDLEELYPPMFPPYEYRVHPASVSSSTSISITRTSIGGKRKRTRTRKMKRAPPRRLIGL